MCSLHRAAYCVLRTKSLRRCYVISPLIFPPFLRQWQSPHCEIAGNVLIDIIGEMSEGESRPCPPCKDVQTQTWIWGWDRRDCQQFKLRFQVLSLCSESHCLCCRHCKCCHEAAHTRMSAVRRFSSIMATTSYDAATLHGRSIIGSSESLIGSNFLQPYHQQQQQQQQQQSRSIGKQTTYLWRF